LTTARGDAYSTTMEVSEKNENQDNAEARGVAAEDSLPESENSLESGDREDGEQYQEQRSGR
jgi:hypothetical protein